MTLRYQNPERSRTSATLFAKASDAAFHLFQRITARSPWWALLLTPGIFALLASLTSGVLKPTRGSGIPQVIAGYTDSVARAIGKANLFLANTGVTLMITTVYLVIVAGGGPMAIASVPLVREATGLVVGLLIVRTVIQAPVTQLLRSLLPIIFSVIVMAALLETARPAVVESFGQPASLAICILMGIAVYASTILLTARSSLLRTLAFVREIR